ncbi:MAG: leucine-rich repeat domain-containing protein [Lachnospiraceae bacterium]|nr:leucine-rich repeat domain-containing protein [Lachnospiraceae bacterium]
MNNISDFVIRNHELIKYTGNDGEVVIPDTVICIKDKAFYQCYGLIRVVIPNSVKEIGAYAFGYCTDLSDINIPDSVEKIGESAFWWCERLGFVEIPDSVKEIGAGAFGYCSRLLNISIPDSVEKIGADIFFCCDNLSNVIASDEMKNKIGWSDESDYVFDESKKPHESYTPCGFTILNPIYFLQAQPFSLHELLMEVQIM